MYTEMYTETKTALSDRARRQILVTQNRILKKKMLSYNHPTTTENKFCNSN